jgi:hypothetical protein
MHNIQKFAQETCNFLEAAKMLFSSTCVSELRSLDTEEKMGVQ